MSARAKIFDTRKFSSGCLGLLLAGMMLGCSSSKPYTLGPIKTFDPDNKTIEQPAETDENFSWETLYLSTFYQLEKPLDLGFTLQKIGHALGIAGRDEAHNVNVLDEVPNSSWFTRRHYHQPMDIAALKRGPNTTGGPDTSRPITVISGKSEGVTPGFTIRDANDHTFIIKLDEPSVPEMKSSSEIIATKLYYAAGYHTPQNSLAFLDPDQLTIGENATMNKNGVKQPMTRADLEQIISHSYKLKNGNIRVLASKYVEGRPLGPWYFWGTRDGDPNDLIPHEDRREIRGLRVLASWLNDTDRRTANTLASYVEEDGQKYIRHYLLDMGSTLGTGGTKLRHTKRGQEYRYDPRYMGLSYITLGLYVKPWAKPEAANRPYYPAIGYYEAELFKPGSWVTSYPNPAFERVTPRDGFWGAKIVMAFTEPEIRAIVETAKLSDPAAEEYLIQVLLKRQEKIGRYWFKQVAPLDQFIARRQANTIELSFTDLALKSDFFNAEESSYRYEISRTGQKRTAENISQKPRFSFHVPAQDRKRKTEKEPAIFKIMITALRNKRPFPDKKAIVYVAVYNDSARVVGLQREG